MFCEVVYSSCLTGEVQCKQWNSCSLFVGNKLYSQIFFRFAFCVGVVKVYILIASILTNSLSRQILSKPESVVQLIINGGYVN